LAVNLALISIIDFWALTLYAFIGELSFYECYHLLLYILLAHASMDSARLIESTALSAGLLAPGQLILRPICTRVDKVINMSADVINHDL
jgi:hypothetical protein